MKRYKIAARFLGQKEPFSVGKDIFTSKEAEHKIMQMERHEKNIVHYKIAANETRKNKPKRTD
jgi:hypothetical protein